MTGGGDALSDVYAKLDWAARRHEEMERLFEDFAKPGGGDERPYGIRYRARNKPAGLVVAFFIVEQPMPLEMSLLAADVVHNTRVALDHVLARLKDHFGGDPGRGSFPTWQSEALWEEKVVKAGNRSALHGLGQPAIELIYAEQPLHRERRPAGPNDLCVEIQRDKPASAGPLGDFRNRRARLMVEVLTPEWLKGRKRLLIAALAKSLGDELDLAPGWTPPERLERGKDKIAHGCRSAASS